MLDGELRYGRMVPVLREAACMASLSDGKHDLRAAHSASASHLPVSAERSTSTSFGSPTRLALMSSDVHRAIMEGGAHILL